MKLSDIMRDIADLLDKKAGDITSGGDTNNHLQPVQPPETELDDNPIMVPPLQQKHELLKKVAGVDNAYDQEADSQEQSNDLNRMKKMAGIVIAGDENEVN
jgi:hypothetical protein